MTGFTKPVLETALGVRMTEHPGYAWSEFIPLLNYDIEIRKIVCTTNAIKS